MLMIASWTVKDPTALDYVEEKITKGMKDVPDTMGTYCVATKCCLGKASPFLLYQFGN
jgi:hypothetical protein